MSTWKFDKANSSAEFAVRHMGVAWVKGRFDDVDAKIEFDPDQPENTAVEAEIAVASISTGNEKRDAHLKSPDFFDLDNHPKIIFKSTEVKKEGDSYKITGDLTMRGITKPVTLEVNDLAIREIPSEDGTQKKAGMTAKTTVNRHDFDISWDQPAGGNETAVGGEVDVTINIEAIEA